MVMMFGTERAMNEFKYEKDFGEKAVVEYLVCDTIRATDDETEQEFFDRVTQLFNDAFEEKLARVRPENRRKD